MPRPPLKDLRDVLGEVGVIARGRGVVVRPATVDDLSRTVECLAGAGCRVSTVEMPADAALDVSGLDRIVEINEADRYVTVETGCTWRALSKALDPRRLRVPVAAPLGRGDETIGRAVDGNFHAANGTLSDIVLGLDVVLADGALVETGAAAAEGRTPFFRHFGPDITGLFLGDGGAFGIKARITLPLIPVAGATGSLSFAFERFEDIAIVQAALAREGLAAAQWGFDPERNELLAARGHRALDGVTFSRNGTIPLRGDRARAAASPSLVD
ncbi:MAG: FAD-binding oxidoreductase, partial [Alphaproteobacteria bacterium]|nr:FAD-binding oxidoreductase [Alphaproteobacteria bacterium]